MIGEWKILLEIKNGTERVRIMIVYVEIINSLYFVWFLLIGSSYLECDVEEDWEVKVRFSELMVILGIWGRFDSVVCKLFFILRSVWKAGYVCIRNWWEESYIGNYYRFLGNNFRKEIRKGRKI